MLVATAPSAQHGLGPTTDLDTRVAADQLVALFGQGFSQQWGDHFLGLTGPLFGSRRLLHDLQQFTKHLEKPELFLQSCKSDLTFPKSSKSTRSSSSSTSETSEVSSSSEESKSEVFWHPSAK